MNVLFLLCFKAVADAGLTGLFCPSSDSVIGGQREGLQRLGTSPARIGFEEVGTLVEEPSEKIKGYGPGSKRGGGGTRPEL